MKDGAPFGHIGLFFVVFGHGAAFEIFPQPCHGLFVPHKALAEGGGNGLFGEIVRRRPQAAGGDDQIGSLFGHFQHAFQPVRVVPAHRLKIDPDAQFRQALGDHGGVGVDDLPQQKLGAHSDNFCSHSNGLPFYSDLYTFSFSLPPCRRPAPRLPGPSGSGPPHPALPLLPAPWAAWAWSGDGGG